MATQNLSDRFCKTIHVERQTDFLDGLLRGLQLRCSSPSRRFPAGVKSWRVVGRIAGDNKLVGIKIGTFPTTSLAEARKMGRAILADMQKGLDPRQVRHEATKRRGKTVAIAWADYLKFYVDQYNRPKTAYDKNSTFNEHAAPTIGQMPIDSVDRRDIEDLLKQVSGGAALRRKVYAYLNHFFHYCADGELIATNPLTKVAAPKSATSRDRVLSPSEIAVVWRTDTHHVYDPLLKVLLLTGQRLRNVVEMRWSQIDQASRLWTIPAGSVKGHPGAHTVPLSDLCLETIDPMPRYNGSDLVFTVNGTTPFANLYKSHKRILAATKTSAWTRHDLRRTTGTILQSKGYGELEIGALLAHKPNSGNATQIYMRHDYRKTKARAVSDIAGCILDIVAKSK